MDKRFLENYLKVRYGIPYVNFDDLDYYKAKLIVFSFIRVLNRYPALSKTICAIGNVKTICNQFNLSSHSNKDEDTHFFEVYKEENFSDVFSTVCSGYEWLCFKKYYYIAISYGKFILDNDINSLQNNFKAWSTHNFSPKHCNNIQSMIYHEMGHVLTFILNLRDDKKLKAIIDKYTIYKEYIPLMLSTYATTDEEELIADAFAEYMMCSKSNRLVNAIGTYIDNKYKKFEKSSAFRINNKYGNNLFTEKEIRKAKELTLSRI